MKDADQIYYERVVMKTLANGPYEVIAINPLYDMINEVNNV